VVLNACQTAVRDRRALDENMGLMAAFLLRGAGVVLATAWSIDDHYASEVVAAFFHQMLRERVSPSQALAQAQQQARAMADQHIQNRCRELLAMFPEDRFPHEARKVCAAGLRSALRARRYDDAREHARHLAVALRCLGADEEARRLETVLREGRDLHAATDAPEQGESCLHHPGHDDPIYWGAFQLIGRVT
jgi:CHAT domain-containing protein